MELGDILKKKRSPLNLFDLALNSIVHLLFQWKPNLEDTAVEKALNSVKLAFQSVIQMKWQKKRDQQHDFNQMVKYIQQLTSTVLKQLFERFVNWDQEHDQEYSIQASHVALFIHHEITEIKLTFTNPRFDFEYLLALCGHLMGNVNELQLPAYSSLPPAACEQLTRTLPNLKILNLLTIKITDDAIKQIMMIYLQELNLSCISERGILLLCCKMSKCKFSLQTLQITNCEVNEKYQGLILESMPALEHLYIQNFRLISLPDKVKQEPLNLRQLTYFDGTSMDIEKELEIAIYACPVVNKIVFEHDVSHFTPRVLLLLSKFDYLTVLCIEGSHLETLYVIEMRWLLPNIRELSIGYFATNFSSGHFFSLLDMCPMLQVLRVSDCDGFNDRIAHQTAQQMSDRILREVEFTFCDMLRPVGIGELLKIPSLHKCLVRYETLRLYDVDTDEVRELHVIACEHNMELDVRLKNSIILVSVNCK